MTTDILPATTQSTPKKRELALLKAIGLDKAAPEMRELALAIADRYGLDPMLRHLVLIDGKPFITRDGLLWIAHRSGQFDGVKVTRPVKEDRYWRADATVWRKDMTHPIEFSGRFPVGAKNDEEMCIKVAESMAYRRAFNVAAPTVDERWANDDAEIVAPKSTAGMSLAEVARAKAIEAVQEGAGPREVLTVVSEAMTEPEEYGTAVTGCPARSPWGDESEPCVLPAGHKGFHKSAARESWE
jgi:hypothetical protein